MSGDRTLGARYNAYLAALPELPEDALGAWLEAANALAPTALLDAGMVVRYEAAWLLLDRANVVASEGPAASAVALRHLRETYPGSSTLDAYFARFLPGDAFEVHRQRRRAVLQRLPPSLESAMRAGQEPAKRRPPTHSHTVRRLAASSPSLPRVPDLVLDGERLRFELVEVMSTVRLFAHVVGGRRVELELDVAVDLGDGTRRSIELRLPRDSMAGVSLARLADPQTTDIVGVVVSRKA